MTQKTIDILGIGNAVLDVIIDGVDDQFIQDNNLIKSGMVLIDNQESTRLRTLKQTSETLAGGSVANTIAALAELGLSTELIATVGDDTYGQIFCDSLSSHQVGHDPAHISNTQTSHCLVFITEERERTMATHLGASQALKPSIIDEQKIAAAKYIYLEGYLFDLDNQATLLSHIIECCTKHDTKIILTLSDKNCIERHHERYMTFIQNNVDIIFCNKAELLALTQQTTYENAQNTSSDICPICVVTLGASGAAIITKEETVITPAINVDKVEDKTGAGDFFAAGFIYRLSTDKPHITAEAAVTGSRSAAYIIQKRGARPRQDYKQFVLAEESL